jgi:hypothetical protein
MTIVIYDRHIFIVQAIGRISTFFAHYLIMHTIAPRHLAE